MKKLLPAACLLLALTACTAAPASSAAAPADTAETADATVGVTMDLAAYTDTADNKSIAVSPRFYLDEALTRPADISEMSCSGSRVTYQVAVPADTTDLYVTTPTLALIETVEEQSAPARAGEDLGAFRVESVELKNGEDLEVVVKIDPASEAFPENLHLAMEELYYSSSGRTTSWAWEDDQLQRLQQWDASFTLNTSVKEARQALETATLQWSELCRYTRAPDLPYTADGITVHSVSAQS